MANRTQPGPGPQRSGKGCARGEKKMLSRIIIARFLRIAKMANLYQYCTPSGCNRWFPKACRQVVKVQELLTGTIFFASALFNDTCTQTTTNG